MSSQTDRARRTASSARGRAAPSADKLALGSRSRADKRCERQVVPPKMVINNNATKPQHKIISHREEASEQNARQSTRKSRQSLTPLRFTPSLLLSLILCIITSTPGIIVPLARASPPVDYFIYTSQLATAIAGTQNVSSILPTIKSIYAPAPSVGAQTPPEVTAGADAASASGVADELSRRQQTAQRQRQLEQLADRVLALVRNESHTHDDNLVDLASTQYAWSLMERQAELYMRNRVHTLRPFIQELLAEAQISAPCSRALGAWLDNLGDLRHWSTLMWNSWGQFPAAGIFQGSYTDLGSYSGCMSIKDNELIGEPQYCMLDFQPIVPTRPRFHSIFKQILGHRDGRLTNGDFELDTPGEQVGTRHVAHNFVSTRFKELYLNANANANNNNNRATSVTSAASSSASKYSKRTIDHSSPASSNYSSGGNLTAPASDGPQEQLQLENLNITLKAEALIELAKRAQYFYYVKFRIGACLPSRCSLEDVRKLASGASQRAVLQSSSVSCMKKETGSQLNSHQLVAICILSGLALIAVLGAIVDLLGFKENRNDSSALINWLLPFSIWTNAKRLFDFETAGTHGDLECIHGLRFFSMLWVIYGHTILYLEYQSFTHFYDVVETQIPSLMLLPSLNANFSVDTFFVISGILTTYVTWEYTKGDARKFNKFAFMVSRYIRLTPQLAIVILCFFILPLFGDGPIYRAVTEEQAQVCYKNWLVNLLYLQSYVSSDKHCIDPSWWLSIEMTFHVVSALVIIVMINNPRRGMMVNFAIAAGFMLSGAYIHYTGGFAIQYLPSIPQRYEITSEQTRLFFHRPYPHAASYFLGIALGYVLANKTIKKLSSSQLIQGWIVCAIGFVVPLWGAYYWNLGAPYTQLQATLYYNLCQVLWPISVAWVILACSLGHGGPVDSILSARCFVPLGRITYMTYLSHSLIIYFHTARMNMTVEPSMLFFTYLFIANTVVALALGVILTVVYESPILNLQKQLFTYLTDKFDPTTKARPRESQCLPTRLTVLASADDSPTDDDPHQQNGFGKQQALSNGRLANSSAVAQCLLLDKDSDKQRLKQQRTEWDIEPKSAASDS